MHFIRKSIHKLFTRRVTRTPEREGRTISIAETRANCLRFQGKREHPASIPGTDAGCRHQGALCYFTFSLAACSSRLCSSSGLTR